MPPPGCDEGCHKYNHQKLDRLRYLELYGAKFEPPDCSVCFHPQGRHFQKQHQRQAGQISQHRQMSPYMIVDAGYNQHAHYANHTVNDLAFQKIHRIIVKALA